jgi:hypothetical protein
MQLDKRGAVHIRLSCINKLTKISYQNTTQDLLISSLNLNTLYLNWLETKCIDLFKEVVNSEDFTFNCDVIRSNDVC